jgi:outer membrane protein OmpA-like peptidoglycan-associated protein
MSLPMHMKSPALAVAIAGILLSASLQAAATDDASDGRVRGKVVDRSSSFDIGSGGNTEFSTSLDGLSGHSEVRMRDLKAMRDSAATLPVTQATRMETLSDSDQGALFESGRDELLSGSKVQLDRIAESVRGKNNLRFLIVGHADTQRLSARARAVYRDNQGLSEARSYQVAQYLRSRLGLAAEAFTVRGEGDRIPVADNATPAGMAKNRRVELQVWHDPVTIAATAAPTPKSMNTCGGVAPAANVPFRITVDGQPMNTADGMTEADNQRCVDVTAERHDLQIQFDPLQTERALNVAAWPNGATRGEVVEFSTYSNYQHWIRKAELRFFAPGQDPREAPFLVLPVQIGSSLQWTVDAQLPAESSFTLRVYDERGRFDETAMKQFSVLDRDRPVGDETEAHREKLTGYGLNSLRVRNITVNGGSVTVSGRSVAKGETVRALGQDVPVDDQGRFVVRQLMPTGKHSIDVRTELPDGEYREYRRNLTIAPDSWFYVALGEFTVADNRTTGPAQLVTQDFDRYDGSTEVTGRGAFYAKGKVRDDYLVTVSADTRERPIEDLFSNFTSKDPRFLLERIDAERAYPTYGDDSTTEWDAPTNGRFYARVEHNDSRATWGNFQTSWTGLEFNQFSRSLYGADLLLKSEESTQFGERRSTTDAFAAEPGTLDSREEFRGTGGSLYYLRRQDITRGSERVWIEVRDETSGITLQRTQLIPGLDYELSYLQGRILLRAPLSSVADDSGLVQLGSLSGNPAFLVTTYEYSPGLDETQSNVYGLRHSTWINDNMRVGVSGYRQGESQDRQTLGGLDATLRYKPGTYLDLEGARSDGAGSLLGSIDGGFGFNQSTTADGRADALRVQGVFDLSEVWEAARGRGSLYWQDREAGFSGAGALAAGDAIRQQGAAFSLPVGSRTSVDVKGDDRDASRQRITAAEAALHHQLSDRWAVSVGTRHDDRSSDVPNASTLLSQNGERTDAILRFDYKPVTAATAATTTAPIAANALDLGSNTYDVTRANVPADAAAQVAARPASWQAYTYVQGTVERTADRDPNDRFGVGAQKQLHDRFRLGGEASEGDGGFGGKLSGDYQIDDRSNVYLAHGIETERQDSNYRGRFGNTVLGGRVKLSDQVSVYDEARRGRGAGPDSLTNAFGVDLAPNDRWTYGVKFEAGTVSDPLAGDLERRAAGLSAAYKQADVKFNSSVEFRSEAGTTGERDTWLARNSGVFQATPEWRLLGKANFSFSDASQGNFFDGNFVDASLGGAYRPIDSDRWNTLVQYRYFYTLPSPGQVGLTDEILDYAQRSHVVSIDTTYDVTPWLSMGSKYAQRFGELRDSRGGGPWYSSRADLVVVRADLHFLREWDVVLESRRLTVHDADQDRSGLLAAAYRHVGLHVKIGAGYNFTDFSDDLTDLSYRSRGPFLNVLSTF